MFRHGFRRQGRKTPEYSVWQNMRQRCNDPKRDNYRHYGGRGIRVCDRWDSFQAFLEDLGPRPVGATLERRDSNGNYTPGNCYWELSYSAQLRNRRRWGKNAV